MSKIKIELSWPSQLRGSPFSYLSENYEIIKHSLRQRKPVPSHTAQWYFSSQVGIVSTALDYSGKNLVLQRSCKALLRKGQWFHRVQPSVRNLLFRSDFRTASRNHFGRARFHARWAISPKSDQCGACVGIIFTQNIYRSCKKRARKQQRLEARATKTSNDF